MLISMRKIITYLFCHGKYFVIIAALKGFFKILG